MNAQISQLLEQFQQDPQGQAWRFFMMASGLYLMYNAGLVVYRLTLHPLAKFPGPLLCRISYFQQCYYEAILNGKFLERFPDYHRKYGPIVRISPNEVHIDDPSVYHEIYKQNSAFTKDAASYALGVSHAMAFTVPVESHKMKRAALDPCFSKRRVGMMEDGLYHELDQVFDKIKDYEKKGEEVPISELWFCYTGDIISHYLFGKSLDLVNSPDMEERAEQMRSFTKGIWIAIHFQFIRNTLLAMPRWVIAYLSNAWVKVLWFTEQLAQQAIAQFDNEAVLHKNPTEETIFDRMLTEHARRREKGVVTKPLSFRELADESTGILNAGTEPTATMMCYATYFFLKYPEVQRRIMEELATVEPENGRLPLQKLENLPYFTGYVKESLRYMPLVPGRLPRTVPKGGLFVPAANATVPEGVVVGTSHMAIHFDPNIFEDPQSFKPERWIGPNGRELNHWLLSFSKGRTDCIGKNLAYAEMHIALANLFTQFDIELTENGHDDMKWIDRVIVHSKSNLRIKVKSKTPVAATA